MPNFKFEFQRAVTRTVEVRQTANLIIKAPNLELAAEAARRIAAEGEVDTHGEEWEDDDSSRVASNDMEIEGATVVRGDDIQGFVIADVSAATILGLDPKEYQRDEVP